MTHRILIVEDERDLVATLTFNLNAEGYHTSAVHTGEEALQAAARDPQPDLIILDIMLPGLFGFEVCRRLRHEERTREIPILLLSAMGDEADLVQGYSVGADDFVVKPFQIRELLLRIRAILRRVRPSTIPTNASIEFGALRVDPISHRVWVDNEEINLTITEYRLLTTFLSEPGHVKTRTTLLNEVWGVNAPVQDRTVDAHIRCLRSKLGPTGSYIETVRGVGYRLQAATDEES
ncbi:MAG: response regulator [Magnetococcales bacterium]|nr:response regulator [Magnetococcales bacterium]